MVVVVAKVVTTRATVTDHRFRALERPGCPQPGLFLRGASCSTNLLQGQWQGGIASLHPGIVLIGEAV